jgi:hypothetical protein
LLCACSNGGSARSDNLNNMAVENLITDSPVGQNVIEAASVPAPAPPSHRYDFKDGDLYGYLGAISENDRKQGVATPSVVRFRYTGFWNGTHHLLLIGDSGSVLEAAECAVPCVAINETDYNGQVHRVGYSQDSIIGAAFEDAIDGQLRRSPTPGTVSNGYRFKGGNPGDASNWQPTSPPPATVEANSDEVGNASSQNLVVGNTF